MTVTNGSVQVPWNNDSTIECLQVLLWKRNLSEIELSVKYIVYTQWMAASTPLKWIQYPLRNGSLLLLS